MSGVDAYRKIMNRTASSRDAEYRLLAQVTAAMLKANDHTEAAPRDPVKMAMVADCANWNKQVWGILMEDVSTKENQFPQELRAAIISLELWVTRETSLVLSGEGDFAALISVNKDIMKGLQPQPQRAAPAMPTTPQRMKPIIDSA
jgi:flagellar protein FlaF